MRLRTSERSQASASAPAGSHQARQHGRRAARPSALRPSQPPGHTVTLGHSLPTCGDTRERSSEHGQLTTSKSVVFGAADKDRFCRPCRCRNLWILPITTATYGSHCHAANRSSTPIGPADANRNLGLASTRPHAAGARTPSAAMRLRGTRPTVTPLITLSWLPCLPAHVGYVAPGLFRNRWFRAPL
jgi:hypothetical protein